MKYFLVLLCLLSPVALSAGTYGVDAVPNVQRLDRTRYVSDPDGILSPQAVATIDSLCAALRRRAIAQVAVVAVDDIEGDDVFTFAYDLFSKWGVGRAENDNGLGILLVKDRREIRFVTGGGLEGVLPDALCKRIQMQYMLPYFREGDYSRGMVAGVEAVSRVLTGSELDAGGRDDYEGGLLPGWAIFVIIFGFVVIPLASSMLFYYRRKRCPRCGAYAMAFDSQRIVETTKHYDLIEYTFICRKCGYTVKRRGKSMKDNGIGGGIGGGTIIGGGRGFRGGSFGGGGGFGGGGFGGGGAGSRW